MAKHGQHKSLIGSVSVTIVIALVCFLFATNIRVNHSTTVSNDTAELIEQKVKEVNALQTEVDELSQQIDQLSKDTTQNTAPSTSEDAGSSTILPAVEGEGLVVTLDDSPLWKNNVNSSGTTADINNYVIHQQDVEAVMNALWAGGAETMQVMDQRMLPNSAVICSGTVLMLEGKKYSPPFTISAIGPVKQMERALNNSRAIAIYQQYVSAYGLGYKVEQQYLRFAQTTSVLQPLKYATVITTKQQ